MDGKLKSQINHTLTGMATKFLIASNIILGSKCRDSVSREWKTNSITSAAGINLMNKDCILTSSIFSVEQNIVGIMLFLLRNNITLSNHLNLLFPKSIHTMKVIHLQR